MFDITGYVSLPMWCDFKLLVNKPQYLTFLGKNGFVF